MKNKNEMKTQERGSFNSASNAKRTRLCPGHRARTKWMIDDSSGSKDAQSGTAIHAALETGDDIELNDRETMIAQECERLLRELIFDTAPKLNGVAKQGLEFKERRFWFNDGNGLLFSGQADHVILWEDDGILLIADYKTGPIGADDASDNDQLKALMTCIYDELDLDPDSISKVVVSIIQPMASPKISIGTYVDDAIGKACLESIQIFKRAESEFALVAPGEDQCKYCKALANCPEANAKVRDLIGDALIIDAAQGEISDDVKQLSKLLEVGELAAKIHARHRDKAKELLQAGANVPGWKIQTQKGRIKIDAEKTLQKLSSMGCSDAALWKSVSITKTAIQKLVKLRTGETGKALDGVVSSVLDGASSEGKPIEKLVRG